MPNTNTPVPNAYQYFPLNDPEIGTPRQTQDNVPLLFQPLTIRGITFKNRIFASPMCQYSSDKGHATDWHLVHLGGFATRGVGAIIVEATAVVPEGRISPEDAGLWTDSQIEPLKRIVDFSHAQGTKIGIQLAHAGRKASTYAPWVQRKTPNDGSETAQDDEGGWPNRVYGPSQIPFSATYPIPNELTERELFEVEEAFVASVERSKKIGFDFIEIHGAHGYLLHEFLSPLSNTRIDQYGGQPLENRLRFPIRVLRRIREAWVDKPLFLRLSSTEWVEGHEKDDAGIWKHWGVEQTNIFVGKLKELGFDLIDCSTGGNIIDNGQWKKQKIPLGPGYQVPFAEALKKAHPDVLIGAVGMITTAVQAEAILQNGQADVILLARELLRNPNWPLIAAKDLNVQIKAANQYEGAWL